jgi:hypothetical protein
MNDLGWVKLAADFGITGVMVVGLLLFYRLADKYAGLFLEAQKGQSAAMGEQATAMASLATAVKDGQSDQREVLIAVRVLAERIDTQKQYLAGIEKSCRDRCGVA